MEEEANESTQVKLAVVRNVSFSESEKKRKRMNQTQNALLLLFVIVGRSAREYSHVSKVK